jgi:hypothetical protein
MIEVDPIQLKQAVEGQHGGKAVLHLGGIRSPLDAVRAAIVAERRERSSK